MGEVPEYMQRWAAAEMMAWIPLQSSRYLLVTYSVFKDSRDLALCAKSRRHSVKLTFPLAADLINGRIRYILHPNFEIYCLKLVDFY